MKRETMNITTVYFVSREEAARQDEWDREEREIREWEAIAQELIRKRDLMITAWDNNARIVGQSNRIRFFFKEGINTLNEKIELVLTMITNARDKGQVRRIG